MFADLRKRFIIIAIWSAILFLVSFELGVNSTFAIGLLPIWIGWHAFHKNVESKIKGDMKYLFALMDDETRFWIAQEVANSKDRHDARNLFKMGKEATGKKPQTLITDGLPAYPKPT